MKEDDESSWDRQGASSVGGDGSPGQSPGEEKDREPQGFAETAPESLRCCNFQTVASHYQKVTDHLLAAKESSHTLTPAQGTSTHLGHRLKSF